MRMFLGGNYAFMMQEILEKTGRMAISRLSSQNAYGKEHRPAYTLMEIIFSKA